MSEHLDFGGLTVAHDERVLRPRTWTSAQSAWVAELAVDAPEGPVLELCAGVGHIGMLAVQGSARHLVCVDASDAACRLARANAVANALGSRVEVRHARLEEALAPGESFPLVIADPPWVEREHTHRFPEDPLTAIDGGHDGLDVARACLEVVDAHLAPGGSAVLQLGSTTQVDALAAESSLASGRLVRGEVRTYPRGVLVRLDSGR